MVTRLIVGISGGSGVIYGIRLLEELAKTAEVETHLVMSDSSERTIRLETDLTPEAVRALATKCYDNRDIAAAPASGSFIVKGMVITPCSMKTLAGICSGFTENLLLRAADVTIKERRPLVLVPRETPLSAIHLGNMLKLARIGVSIVPAMPGFYHRPKTMDDLINHVVGKVLDHLGIEHSLFKRWKGPELMQAERLVEHV